MVMILRRMRGEDGEMSLGGRGYDARAVANYFLNKAWDEDRNLTPMQVLKLVYIAHGWTLAIMDNPLIRDPVQAREYGPVIRSVYDSFKRFGGKEITELATAYYPKSQKIAVVKSDFIRFERDILDKTWEIYGNLEGFQLSGLTHREGTPWQKVWENRTTSNARIPNELIRDHYIELAGLGGE